MTASRSAHKPCFAFLGMVVSAVFLCPKSALCESVQRAEVLIYYANETAPDDAEAKNYQTIIGWLRSSAHPRHQKVAETLEQDIHVFPAAVDVEVHSLKSQLPKTVGAPNTVVITNRLCRQGKCLVWRTDWPSVRRVDLKVPSCKDRDYITKSNPLSCPDTFQSFLGQVARWFDPGKHNFVLITKSHGSTESSITTRLRIRSETISRDEVLRRALIQQDDAKPLDEGQDIGITKEEYFYILGEAGKQWGMQFTLVYPEACCSTIDDSLIAKLSSNIGCVCYNSETTSFYINLIYPDILRQMKGRKSFAGSMMSNLPSKFVLLHPREYRSHPPVAVDRLASFPMMVYFTPLALWVVWGAWMALSVLRRTRSFSLHPWLSVSTSSADRPPIAGHPLLAADGHVNYSTSPTMAE